jgi:hypothetical protein
LRAVAQGSVDGLVGEAAAGVGRGCTAIARTVETVDVQDLDAVDVLHGFHRLFDDAGQGLDQGAADLHGDLFGREEVGGFVDFALAFGFGVVDLTQRIGAQLFGVGAALRCDTLAGSFGLGNDADGVGIVGGGGFLSLCGNLDRDCRLFGGFAATP